MKKLNRKGFTLIELLAVVVILAVILVVTIPSVLDTMDTAKKQSFDDAVEVIRDYAQKQYDLCKLGLTAEITFGTDCAFPTDTSVITTAGYAIADISKIAFTIDDNKVEVDCATATDGGNFVQSSTHTPCPQS